jgi:hypothetical protein
MTATTSELMTHSDAIEALCHICREDAVANGWWQSDRNEAELIALMHSELSEALESVRAKEPDLYYDANGKPEGKLSEYADVLIRIFDAVGPDGAESLAEAVVKKIEFNRTRGHRHGGKAF